MAQLISGVLYIFPIILYYLQISVFQKFWDSQKAKKKGNVVRDCVS